MPKPCHLCQTCKQILHNYSPESEISRAGIHHGSPKLFLEALGQDCFICPTIWASLDPEYQSCWRASLPSERITTFRLYFEEFQKCFLKLAITLPALNALSAGPIEIRFRLVSANEPQFQNDSNSLQLEDSTSSLAAMNLALTWWQTCRDTHPRCNISAVTSKRGCPSRLIYIGCSENTNCKLCIRENGSLPSSLVPYATLSYRWGTETSIKLLGSNRDDLLQCFPKRSLPQTFQDAITVARHLSLEYLWIDALCIIQDSTSDWELEAPTMRYVYANSACNIAASASANQFSGLFQRREPSKVLPGYLKLPNCLEQDFVIYDKNYFQRHIHAGPLHVRGWVFQECLLAPRVLYFGEDQVLWKCLTTAQCEGFPLGIPYHVPHNSLDHLWDKFRAQGEASEPYKASEKMSVRLHAIWQTIVEKYSACNLTMPSDKLPAISGIAKLFAEVTGDRYVAGLWESRLLEQLHWLVIEPRQRCALAYRAPSWSWASVDGPVRPLGLSISTNNFCPFFKATVQHSTKDPTGRVSSAVLELQGTLSTLQRKNDAFNYDDDDQAFEGSVFPDFQWLELDTEIDVVYFLPLRSRSIEDSEPPHEQSVEVTGLVLQAISHTQPNCFQRLGYFITMSIIDISRLNLVLVTTVLVGLKDGHHLTRLAIV